MRNKNKLPLRNVLPKANDFSGLLGKGVSESEIMLAGELFNRQMVEKRRKRSAKAQSKAEAEERIFFISAKEALHTRMQVHKFCKSRNL